MYIYLIKNIRNGKWYLGKRTTANSFDFTNYYGSGSLIKQAIEKEGRENFVKTVLAICNNKEELADKEYEFLQKYFNEKGPDSSYNVVWKRQYCNGPYGHKQSKIHVLKRVEAMHKSGGYVWSEERRLEFSRSKKGKPAPNKGLKCEGIRVSKLGGNNPMARKVIDTITGRIFDSITEAAEVFGINKITLHCYISGSRTNKTTLSYA